MSAFDDEFGLFGEESEEEERHSTLGARRIASAETVIDEIEPEDEPTPRRRRGRPGAPAAPSAPAEKLEGAEPPGGRRFRRPSPAPKREPLADSIVHPRAVELLTFLAKKLVAKPDAVSVALHPDARGAVLELEVDPDDLGKVIGRGGRVAQGLRTLVRASAEGRVTVDIVDAEDDEEEEEAPEVAEASPAADPGAAEA
jgi:predicted RNA-binding protein YlqC (UPF0109 family)